MERISHWAAWLVVALIVVFAGLNWTALTAPTALDFGVMQMQAPMGLLLLALMAVFVALFFIATLYSRVVSLMETKRLNKELRAAQQTAERAEASRIDALQRTMVAEFRQIGERLSRIESDRGVTPPTNIVATPLDRLS